MDFFLALLISGLLSGSVYALVGAAFVVVYRASSVLNFSLGEWVSLGARLTGVGYQTIGLPLVGAMAVALGPLSGAYYQICTRTEATSTALFRWLPGRLATKLSDQADD